MGLYLIFRDGAGQGHVISTEGIKKGHEEISDWATKKNLNLTGQTIVFTHIVEGSQAAAAIRVNDSQNWAQLNKFEHHF